MNKTALGRWSLVVGRWSSAGILRRSFRRLGLVACGLLLVASTAALGETLQGTVTNGTNGSSAAGVEVTLLSLAQGMTEVAHGKSDAAGHFTLNYSDSGGMPHLVQVTHQGVNYFTMAPPGSNSVQMQVFDSAKKLEGIATTVEIMRLQSDGNSLQVLHIYAVRNASQPARTLVGDQGYEVAMPHGAILDEAAARAPGGEPINATPEPVKGAADRYAFDFPLRPGETQFQIAYHLPYPGGQATVNATLLHDVQHFVAVLPPAMHFSATGAVFSPMPQEKDANVQVATNARAGDRIVMTVSGTGELADENNQGPQEAGGAAPRASGPGGGLGNPIGSPDPLSRYRWPLLGALAAIMAAGGFYVVSHRPVAAVISAPGAIVNAVPEPAARPQPAQTPKSSVVLLEAIKEELFQLEIDHQQGRIGEEEYRQAKTALDTALRRALQRASLNT
jgi:hypothetical protein